jgi:hypothetical protein
LLVKRPQVRRRGARLPCPRRWSASRGAGLARPTARRRVAANGDHDASRFFLQYYLVELLFSVLNHFGVDDETALKQSVDLLKFGMFKRP